MEIAILRGLAIGFVICIPIGPVNVAVIDTAIRRRWRLAMAVGLGGAVVDFIYSQLAVTALGAFISHSPRLSEIMKFVGGAILIGYGIVVARQPAFEPPQVSEREKVHATAVLAAFGTGVLLMVLNPATLISWLMLAGVFLTGISRSAALFTGFGVFFGATLWFALVAFLAKKGRIKMGSRAVWITRVVAVLLVVYGVFLVGRTGLVWASGG